MFTGGTHLRNDGAVAAKLLADRNGTCLYHLAWQDSGPEGLKLHQRWYVTTTSAYFHRRFNPVQVGAV